MFALMGTSLNSKLIVTLHIVPVQRAKIGQFRIRFKKMSHALTMEFFTQPNDQF